jgi:hypothetical protein
MANKSARRKKTSRANLNKRTHQRANHRRTRNKGEHAPQLTNYLLEPHPEL